MHVVVLGAGALGTLFGARAWLGGGASKVTLVARGEHAAVIRRRGVVIRSPSGNAVAAFGPGLAVVTEVGDVDGVVDFLLVTVKDANSTAALEEACALRGRVGCVASLQNGIAQDDRLADTFGRETVIGAMTMEGAAMPEPGVVDHLLASTTYLGELDGVPTERVKRLADVLGRAGFATEVVDDIGVARWTKFVQSCAASGVCGASRLGYAPATATETGARLYIELVKEGVSVMRALGMEPAPYFTDAARVREIADLPVEQAIEVVRSLARRMIDGRYLGTTSLARDLEQGRPTEVDAILGTMSRTAERVGVDAPVTRAVFWAIKAVDEVASSG